ncbi:PD40 domain-containing protein [Flavobacterium magnum]|nr:PD40 domain-containing protein [Flavobacterium magnum]
MKNNILFLSLMAVFSVHGQQVQWAGKLIKFSSDLGGKQHGIKRILGKPDAFPQGGPSANAWMPKNALDGNETVEVGFETPQTVKQVAVFENMNAGCVVRIAVDDGSGKYKTVWSRDINWRRNLYTSQFPADRKYYYNRKRRKIQSAPEVDVNPGIEHAILDQAVAHVVAVRVDFSFALVPGQKQVDAIGISDSETPMEASIHSAQEFASLPRPEKLDLGGLMPSNPILNPDGNKLYFTDFTNPKEVIYSCIKNDGRWSAPSQEMNALNDDDQFNYLYGIHDNWALKGGKSYSRGTGETGYAFYGGQGDAMAVSGILKVAAYNNYDDTSELTISADAQTIIMGIETDMTQGGADLYFSNRKEDGSYGFLQNMGKAINSAADESMPRLLSDNKTLLFSSNGFSNYGDYDIFVTYRLDDSWKNWSEPVNLGSSINSGSFDGSPWYDERNGELYFIRTVDGQTGIYHVHLPKSQLMKG